MVAALGLPSQLLNFADRALDRLSNGGLPPGQSLAPSGGGLDPMRTVTPGTGADGGGFGRPTPDPTDLSRLARGLLNGAQGQGAASAGAAGPMGAIRSAVDDALEALREEVTKTLQILGLSRKEAEKIASGVAGAARSGTESPSFQAQMSTLAASETLVRTGSGMSYSASVTMERASVSFNAETGEFTARVERVSIQLEVRTGSFVESDPLILDLDGNGTQILPPGQGTWFDLDGDGREDRTAWVGGRDAFLALDRNGNGTIDSGKELFGDQNGAPSGFDELAKFDENDDGRINAQDSVFEGLLLVYADERVGSLREAGVEDIRFDARVPLNERVDGGTKVDSGQVTFADGRTGQIDEVWLDMMA